MCNHDSKECICDYINKANFYIRNLAEKKLDSFMYLLFPEKSSINIPYLLFLIMCFVNLIEIIFNMILENASKEQINNFKQTIINNLADLQTRISNL